MFDLDGRTVVVTGASRGIGAALAQGLAAAGATVHGLSRTGRGEDETDGVHHHACDLADPMSAVRTLEAVLGDGPLHVLINAAGVSFPGPDATVEAAVERMQRTFTVNVTAAFALSMAAVPLMRDGGSIINVTSINADLGFPGNPGYVASKSALAGLTRALAIDLADRGIRVNSLAPGYMRTSMTRGSYEDPVQNRRRADRTALGRWGEPDDLVGAAVFLASGASAYVTGQQLFVDGGWTIQGLPR